jgi:hypothetical protein
MEASPLAFETVARWLIPNIQFSPAKLLRRNFGAIAKAEVLYGGQVQQGMSNDEGSPLYHGYTTAPYSTTNSTRGHTDCFPSIFDIEYWIFNTPIE